MYIITLLIFFFLVISPFIFFLKENTRKNIFILQIICFAYWNIVFWGVLYQYLPMSLAVFGTGDPEGSIFMLYWLFTPIMSGVLLIEVIYLLIKLKKS